MPPPEQPGRIKATVNIKKRNAKNVELMIKKTGYQIQAAFVKTACILVKTFICPGPVTARYRYVK